MAKSKIVKKLKFSRLIAEVLRELKGTELAIVELYVKNFYGYDTVELYINMVLINANEEIKTKVKEDKDIIKGAVKYIRSMMERYKSVNNQTNTKTKLIKA